MNIFLFWQIPKERKSKGIMYGDVGCCETGSCVLYVRKFLIKKKIMFVVTVTNSPNQVPNSEGEGYTLHLTMWHWDESQPGVKVSHNLDPNRKRVLYARYPSIASRFQRKGTCHPTDIACRHCGNDTVPTAKRHSLRWLSKVRTTPNSDCIWCTGGIQCSIASNTFLFFCRYYLIKLL